MSISLMKRYVEEMVEKEQFRGAVLVKRAGQRQLCAWFGVLDDGGRLNGPRSRFYLGSITKQFTGVGVALLMQEGRIDLDEGINGALPERYRQDHWERVTLRHLLTNSSGIPYYGPVIEDISREKLYDLDEIVAQFSKGELRFEPGTKYDYNNSNFALLGALTEERSGLSYGAFLRSRIFERFGMKDTGLFGDFPAEELVWGYYMEGGKPQSIEPGEMAVICSKAFSAGGLVSTLEDMERWDEALHNEDFLEPEVWREMMKTGNGRAVYDPRGSVGEERVHYGFGMNVDGDGVYHGGQMPGTLSFIVRNVKTRDCVVVLCNQNFDNSPERAPLAERMAQGLWDLL